MSTGLRWRKSSYSNSEGGACIEVALSWHKSSYSDDRGGDCIEVAPTPHTVHVRDSKNQSGPQLAFSPSAWTDFVTFAAAHTPA
ncbi:DUF397 domain-containing protein [Kitasatospora mediocidica]|uniref:DUF397 domain-containing protein n=1 Tax=Kitasatospora mediocidica TaxID=58352 RepID=UPI00056C7EB8|nr:DUF397 domain-containing protein [Kitasatospora mediocidica]